MGGLMQNLQDVYTIHSGAGTPVPGQDVYRLSQQGQPDVYTGMSPLEIMTKDVISAIFGQGYAGDAAETLKNQRKRNRLKQELDQVR